MASDSTLSDQGAGQVDGSERMRELATAAIADGDPLAWYEELYAGARAGSNLVPWDHGEPTPFLVDWLEQRFPGKSTRGRAVVVGCAYGDDAELTAEHGFDTSAFDISLSAISAARDRHPGSPVQYRQADLLDLPTEWVRAFDLVVECTTLQCLPPQFHRQAAAGIGSLCAPGGAVLVVARAAAPDSPPGPPWLLTEAEVRQVAADGVEVVRVESAPLRGGDRWVGEFARPRVR